jgi:AcrR family transcriptional regulator
MPQDDAAETSRRSAARRSRILQAALACFNERGFTATTIEEICQRSGASVGSVYHHFGGKEGLAAALYVEGLRAYQRGFRDVLEQDPGAEEGIKGLVRHHLGWTGAHRDLARFLLTRRETELVLATEAPVRDMNQELFSATRRWLRPHVEAGSVRPLPLDLFYTLLIGPAQEFARSWVHGQSASSIEQAADVLAEAAWLALRGSASLSAGPGDEAGHTGRVVVEHLGAGELPVTDAVEPEHR